jgi:uncharacterized SAM-binding protein YcdF (DUF218 family)
LHPLLRVTEPLSRPPRADAIVVLGRGVDSSGRLPVAAAERVAGGVKLFQAGVAPRIIMSGRFALLTDDDEPPPCTEARAMADAACAAGVPSDAILLEEQSRDTIGNAWFTARRILEPNGWDAIRVVTSEYHVPRASWVFGKVLGDAVDVSFSPVSSEAFAKSIAQRARQESAIAEFLMDWIGELASGDRTAIDHFINHQHPAYADAATMSIEEIDARVDEIAKLHRDAAGRVRGHRVVQERHLDL